MASARFVGIAAAALIAAAGCAAEPTAEDRKDGGGGFDAAPVGWTTRAELEGLELRTVWGKGRDLFAAGVGASLARSDDGGGSWHTVDTGVKGSGAEWPVFRQLAGTSGTDVWLVGGVADGESVLLHSADQGRTWQTRATGEGNDVRAVWALDAQRVVIATGRGMVLRSQDGGATWARAHEQPGVKLLALWGAGDEVFAAGGVEGTPAGAGDRCDGGETPDAGAGDERGVLLRSVDGGKTWVVEISNPGGVLRSVWGTPDARTVLAAGAHASIALTGNHGESWYVDGRAGLLDFDGVWVGPLGAFFFASPAGVVRSIDYDCRGPVTFSMEQVPAAADGSKGTSAVWGPSSDDVWAVGPGGAIRHRP
jgi:photosystem II stability/assembly factor-like uncharacterized protein